MKRLILVAMVAAALAVAPKAEAASITGGITFGGSAAPSGGTTWANATGINFNGPNANTTGGSGSYASVAYGTQVTFTDFSFGSGLSPSPVNPLWTFTYPALGSNYSFIMNSIGQIQQGFNGGSSFLLLHGTGILHIDGYTDTPGTFDFSGQDSSLNFSFSASGAAVPEPGSMVLLGTGLLGLAAMARRRMKKA